MALEVLLGAMKETLGKAPALLLLLLPSRGVQVARESVAGAAPLLVALSTEATLARTRRLSGERKIRSPRGAS